MSHEARPAMPAGTPAARWREEGKPDPHGDSYDCERAALCGGHLSDDEVAYQTAMLMRGDLNHEAVLQTAKDRIRWLSRKLIEATTGDVREAAPEREATVPDDVRRLVIAAREFWDMWESPIEPESAELDKALEAFASRVPYANEQEHGHDA